MNLLGAWELQRSTDRSREIIETQADFEQFRTYLETLAAKRDSSSAPVMVDIGGGKRMELQAALSRVTELLDDLSTLQPLTTAMTWLARVVIVLGLLAALVGGLGMFGLQWAGARALHSRDQLLHTFNRVSRVLPYVLVGHIIVMGTAVSAVLAFEALGIWHAGRMSGGEFKLMIIALIIMGGFLYSIWQMGKQLRFMLHMFESSSMAVLGQTVSVEQAPVLWAHVNDTSRQLGALAPDQIVLGMSEGFYVTSSDIDLLPSGLALKGRTLHVPIMYLGVLDSAETTAVIGHELAHFAGADTEYSLRFLPIYDGIGRSLGVIAQTMLSSDALQRTILRPAFMLGVFFMESFDHAVHHWSRVRELEADAAGAKVAGNLAAASALVRISAIDPVLQDKVQAHIAQAANLTSEQAAATDLPTAVLHELAAQPLSLPEEEMATQLPHPSDTHPSNGERVASLQVDVDDAVRSGTRPLDAAQACAAMDRYFADPQAVRTRITQDYLGYYVKQDAAAIEELRTHAGNVTGEVILHEGAHLRGTLILIFCALLTLAAIVLAAMPSLSRVLFVIAGLLMLAVLCILPFALRMRARALKTALLLTPDHFVFANLKAPLPIMHIADFGVQIGKGFTLNILLEDDAPLPEVKSRSFFAPDARVFTKNRWVQLELLQFCRDNKTLKPQDLAELIGNYINAGTARHMLAQRFEQA